MSEELLKYFNNDELAANVWLSKYAVEGEKTPDDMHRRLAKEFAKIEESYRTEELNLSKKKRRRLSSKGVNLLDKLKKSNRDEIENHIYQLFKDFKYVVPQGSIMSTLGTDIIASLSNCWVAESPVDSYGGILKTDGDLAYYYKRRGGVGTDISNLRPNGTKTNNTSKSSTGAVSFMHRFSNTTREVAMNGRRGALMLSIDINHPDVMDFIKIKRDGTSVTGANISIKLNDEFMKAVENNEDYILRFPCDVPMKKERYEMMLSETEYNVLKSYVVPVSDSIIYFKKVKAKEYWDEIIKSAKNHAEPGLMYWDNVLDNDPAAVYNQYTPTCSNPCGEQFLNPNDSCRLMALNLFSFVKNPFTENAIIDTDKLYNIVYEFTRLGDDLIDLELEYIQRIIDKIKSDPEADSIKRAELELWEKSYINTKAGRRIGLGITGLGDMLAALGTKYDSDYGLGIVNDIMELKLYAELDCTIDLAILRGTFEGFNASKEFLYSKNLKGEYAIDGKNNFYQLIVEKYPDLAEKMIKYGRRNVSWSTIAPTGSVSILTQTTSGCEPLFQPFYMRRKKINPNEEGVRVDFIDEIGDCWQEFPVLHPKFKDWIIATGKDENSEEWTENYLLGCFKESPWYKSTANDIDWVRRNEMQSILQKYTTNAISSTINLPSTVTEGEVSDIYFSGWKLGLKGQTVYVDGSRSGVLVTNTDKKETFSYHDAPKRPKDLIAEVHHTNIKKIPHNVIVGLLDNKPYEIFIDNNNSMSGIGVIIKKKKGNYFFKQGDITVDITSNLSDEQAAISRLVSTSLRHGTDIKFIVEQLNKIDGDLFGFTKGLARVLKKYIPDGTKSTVTCNDCGSDNVIFEEGCNKCLDCGSSKCG